MALTDDRFVSYAQNLEDVMLWRALRDEAPAGGRYIDVGAADPTALSVTRAFYDRGWRGVNVEPLPDAAAALRRARPGDVVVEAALAAAPGTRPFYRVVHQAQTGLSTFDLDVARRHERAGARIEQIEVPVTTLAALCREHAAGPVQFLKIDVEGAEAEVLAGADFTACRPWIVVVEVTEPLDSGAADLPWEAGLLASGYRAVWFDGLNRFYLADERAALARHFRVPPNVFDHYTVFDAPLQDYLAATEALAATRLQAIERLEAELAELNGRLDDRTQQPAAAAGPHHGAVPAAMPLPAAVEAPPAPADSRERIALPLGAGGLGRRVTRLAYGVVRPLVRPLAWRLRQFLIGELKGELDGHRIRLDQLIARPATSTEGGINPALLGALERALLTLALEDGRHAGPPYLPEPPCLAEPPSGLSKTEAGG